MTDDRTDKPSNEAGGEGDVRVGNEAELAACVPVGRRCPDNCTDASAGGHHPDRRELAGSGEGEKGKKAGLKDREVGGDARGAKSHPVGAHSEGHTERVAEGLARRRGHVHSLTQPDEGCR